MERNFGKGFKGGIWRNNREYFNIIKKCVIVEFKG